MAATTYLIRVIPFVLVKHRIKNVYIRSFLTYIPYAVLAAMTFPAILYSTSSVISAAAGLVCAVILSYFGVGLMGVAVASCAVVYIADLVMTLL